MYDSLHHRKWQREFFVPRRGKKLFQKDIQY